MPKTLRSTEFDQTCYVQIAVEIGVQHLKMSTSALTMDTTKLQTLAERYRFPIALVNNTCQMRSVERNQDRWSRHRSHGLVSPASRSQVDS